MKVPDVPSAPDTGRAAAGTGAAEATLVEDIFQTDPISALGLPSPVSIGRDASVGAALEAVQRHGMGYVLIVEPDGRPAGIMSEREVLMKIVARDVKYDAGVDKYMSHDRGDPDAEGPDRRGGGQMMNRGRGAQHPNRRCGGEGRRGPADAGHHPFPGGGVPGAGAEPAAAAPPAIPEPEGA